MCALSVVALSSFHAPPTHWNHAIMLSSFHCCNFIFFSLLSFIASLLSSHFIIRAIWSGLHSMCSCRMVRIRCPCNPFLPISSARVILQHQFQVPVPSCIVHFKCQCRLTTSFEVSVSVSLSVSVRSRCLNSMGLPGVVFSPVDKWGYVGRTERGLPRG